MTNASKLTTTDRTHTIKKANGALDENDLEKVTGGITFVYGKLSIEYTPQKPDGTDQAL